METISNTIRGAVSAMWSGRTAMAGLALISSLTGCMSTFRPYVCEPLEIAATETLPQRLSETGLYRPGAPDALMPGVRAYTPRFGLWSDGSEKQRWIYLPPGGRIDTADPNAWRFPVGTKLWKELSRDGVRMETRLLYKYGEAEDAWAPVSYIWTSSDDAIATPAGADDVGGTTHDVPSAIHCMGCHGGVESRVLGFSAVQLERVVDDREPEGSWSLRALDAADRVTHPVDLDNTVPGEPLEAAALGYLHANCSHCHNTNRPDTDGPRCYDPDKGFDLSLRVGELDSTEQTAVYRTAIGDVVRPGHPRISRIYRRMNAPQQWMRMPVLGVEEIDEQGVAMLVEWIESLD